MLVNNISITAGPGGPGIGGVVGIDGKGGEVHVTYIYEPGSSAPLTSLPRADYARHDSGREDAPLSCLEGTRVAILDEVMSWLENANGEWPPIYWLNGLAGTGKSTIAKTITDRAEGRGMLGASFFFSRGGVGGGPLHDPQLVFPTIAFQLAQSDNTFKNVILEAVQQDATLGYKKLLPQLQGLIVRPLLKIDPNRRPTLIILDALDECEESGAAEILRLLFSHGTRIPFLRILITSRPEPHISWVFDDATNYAKKVLHDIEASVIQQDLRFYFHTEFAKISQKLRLHLDTNWVSEDEINLLVERSGSLFVYAATSIRFISDDRVRNPRQHLRLILSTQTAQAVGASPYTQLDNLYLGVLRNSLFESNRRDILERFQVVVGTIVLLREPLPLHSLAQFVQYEMDEIDSALYHLRSIIISPSNDHEAPRIYHASFRDFIMDASRCSDMGFLIVPIPVQERRHAIRCLELLARFLKRDVAEISDLSLLNGEVDGFEWKVRDALSPEVRYACRYWASHLSRVQSGDEVAVRTLDKFLMRLILWWFEAMSLIGSVSIAVSSIQEAHRWATNSKCEPTLVTMLADAHRFILAHAEVIRASALHVYQSALPFTPRDTALYKAYWKEASHSIRVLQGVESQWPQSLSSLLGHYGSVDAVVYSSDGLRLASGSEDCSVRLWDATSGTPIAILEGHAGWVRAIAFSQDGLRLASGSDDHSVRLWDAVSGEPVAILEDHSDCVRTVAFSPNSLRLASGSDDYSVRLWDAKSGMPIIVLGGHSGRVRTIAFSLNGLRLASGSDDCSVRLWDAISGAPIATLSHSGRVWTITFSPDGLQLASGSEDRSVRLWDAMSGTPIATLEGHSSWILSAAFSPDGLRLASGSNDHSIRLWDAKSHTPIATLNGHFDRVWSVAFSPDGLQLASGAGDCSVRLWDAKSGAPIAKLEGHAGWVWSVAFSQDGLQVVSGSEDRSVRLWDPMTNGPVAVLEGHSDRVCSVIFSPDGLQLASCSNDCSVQLWDAVSGARIAILEGHSDWVWSIAFSPDGLRLASGSEDHSVRLWDVTSGALIAALEGHSHRVCSVVFSPDGLRLASCSNDCSVRLWDIMSGALTATLEGHSDSVWSIAFSTDGQTLTSNTHTETFMWNLTSLPPHRIGPPSFTASYSSSVGLPPLIWSRSGQWIQMQRPSENHVRRICYIPPLYSLSTGIAVPNLPIFSRIAMGCDDGRIIILDIQHHLLCT